MRYSPWEFNLYTDVLVREVNASVLGEARLRLSRKNWTEFAVQSIVLCRSYGPNDRHGSGVV